MRTSANERLFKEQYPYAHIRPTGRKYKPFAVYAGDYLCCEGRTRAEAYGIARSHVAHGLITPDPAEQPTQASFREDYSQ